MCSGYGGLDMGLQSVIGGRVAWHFEYDKAPSRILEHHFPHIPNHGDLTKADWDSIEPVDWITAGYPCQPFSVAGNRKGTHDTRHIWPYIKDAIRVLRPSGVLLENVAGHLSLGFGTVLGDLAQLGYDAKWVCVRASDAGAPHARKRIFIVANPNSDARSESRRTDRSVPSTTGQEQHRADRQESWGGHSAAANTDGNGSQERNRESSGTQTERHGLTWPGFGPYLVAIKRWEQITGRTAPDPIDPNSRLTATFVEWMMGLPHGWVSDTGIPWTAQMKALGNGVVPQQAALAMRLLGVTHA